MPHKVNLYYYVSCFLYFNKLFIYKPTPYRPICVLFIKETVLYFRKEILFLMFYSYICNS